MRVLTNGCVVVDNDTGEVVLQTDDPGLVSVVSPERQAQMAHYAALNSGGMAPDTKYRLHNNQGTFVWSIFDVYHDELIGLHSKLKPATLTRLMVLATYIGKHGYLSVEGVPMNRGLMQRTLRIASKELSGFVDELTQCDILRETDGLFYLNPDFFRSGKFPRKEMRSILNNAQSISRLYKTAVRELFREAYGKASLYHLSYLFRVMPYVNRRYNVVCRNPEETNASKIEPLTVGDLAELVGKGRKHAGEFKEALSDPIFFIPDGRSADGLCRAVYYVSNGHDDVESQGMYINPRVYYAGYSWNYVAALSIWK